MTSANNIITTGNLDVELEYFNGEEWEKVTATTNVFEKNTLWEPGHTEVVYLKVSNVGTLALKYQLGVNVASEVTGTNIDGDTIKLSDIIVFGAVENQSEEFANREAAREAVVEAKKLSEGYSKSNYILPNGEPQYVALVVYMPETTGNEANYKTGTTAPTINLGINLFATQHTYEHDTFGNDYDAEALGLYNVVYNFDTSDDLTAFDPAKFDPDATNSVGLTVENGKAVVNEIGAFYFKEVDLAKHEYTIEYDVDLTELSAGESITFNTGDTATWSANTPVTIFRGSAKVVIGGDVSAEKTFESTVLHITHVYALNSDGVWVTTTTVSNGTDSLTNTKKQQNYPGTGNNIFWDIEGITESGKVTLDNFAVYASAIDIDKVLVTPETLASTVWEDNTTYAFEGTFTDVDFIVPAGLNVVLDGEDATFDGHVKVTFNRIADGVDFLTETRTGNYVIQNFTVNDSLSIGACSVESLTVDGCSVEMLDFNASNTAVNITDNKIIRVSADSYIRYDGGANNKTVFFYADNYDLVMSGNTITDTVGDSNLIVIQGDYENYQKDKNVTWDNSISMTGNILTCVNDNIVKIYNDVTYAPVAWPAEYEITEATQKLAEQLFGSNTTEKNRDNAVIEILCRAAGKGDLEATELNHDVLKSIAEKY